MELIGMVLLGALICIGGFAIYFLPSFIGWKKRSSGAIVALNLLLGWTFIGWVLALIWSLTAEQPSTVILQSPSQQLMPPEAPMFCSACGKYAPAASRFCQSCGRALQEGA